MSDLLPNLDALLAALPDTAAGHDAHQLATAAAETGTWQQVDAHLDRVLPQLGTPVSIDSTTDGLQVDVPPRLVPDLAVNAPPQIVRPASAVVWLEIRGFRAFGTEARRLELDASLVVVHAGNSQGKTSLAEAVEFLITGCSSRRDLLGGAKSEYKDSLRNAHLPAGDAGVYVAAGVRGADGVTHEVRRELLSDFPASGPACSSRLLVDGEEQADLSGVGLPMTDPPMSAPVLLQHTLRYVLSTEPGQRVAFFKALLAVTDLGHLRTRVAGARSRLGAVPQGPAVQAVTALARTPLVQSARALLDMDLDNADAAQAVEAVLLEAGRSVTGAASTGLPGLAEDLAATTARQREAAFPLAAFTVVTAVPADPASPDLSEYTRALGAADRAATSLAPVIEAVLAVPDYQGLTEDTDCPVCATPLALTPARLGALREQMRRTANVDDAAAAATTEIRRLRATTDRLLTSVAASVPHVAAWAPAQAETAAELLTGLGLQHDQLDGALRAAARTAAAAEECTTVGRQLAELLRLAEGQLQRREDVPPALTDVHMELTTALQELRAAREATDAAAATLSTEVGPAVRARTATPGLAELRAAVDHAELLIDELSAQRERNHAIRRVEAAEKALVAATSSVLDTRFEQMSEALIRWWLTVRPDELVGFSGLTRRAGGQMFVNLVADLRTDWHTDAVQRDALGVYSDSQLNALGLATFLARAQLLNLPLLVLDDPIPGSDSDHRLTFAQNTLGALLDDGRQVILTTFDHKLYDLATTLHSHRDHLTYELVLTDVVAGTEPTQTSDAFSRFMLEAEDTLTSPTPSGRRAACGSYRSAAERLAKQIIATGRTQAGQPCSVTDVENEAKMLGDLVPLVRGFAIDNAEKGQWTSFAKVLNSGNHDDSDVPSTAALKVVKGNLRAISKTHTKRWVGGLVR